MRDLQFSTAVRPEEHDAFVRRHPMSNLLQSSSWARIKDNWDHLYAGVYEDGKLAVSALVLIRSLPFGTSLFYLPRGPVFDLQDREALAFFLKELKKTARKHKALFVKMDPSIPVGKYTIDHPEKVSQERLEELASPFTAAGCRYLGPVMEISQSIQPRFHAIVDLQENLEESFPRKTRRYIREARKKGVRIVSGGKELLDDFARMVEHTEKRKGVALRDRAYFEKLLDAYPGDSVIMLALINPAENLHQKQEELKATEKELENLPANQKKKRFTLEEKKASIEKDIEKIRNTFAEGIPQGDIPISGVLSVIYGDQAEMLYAGMDERFARYAPQYLEYLENMQWALDRGCSLFSMGGVEGSLDDGLSRFKNHFAPNIHEYIGEFDLPVWPGTYPVFRKLYERRKAS